MIVEPKVRGFICTTAHPVGCAAHVQSWIDYVRHQKPITHPPKKVLVIGASTGYGLASRIVAAFGGQAKTIGVFFERPAEGKRTASAGWYNSAAFENAANQAGVYAKSMNGDAFSDEIKQQTIDLIQKDWNGGVDLVIYSLASPVRKHPKTGELFRSVLKPIGKTYTNKTVDMVTGVVSDISIEPANSEEIANTVAVMGGEDWEMWMDALSQAGVLADNVNTVAYSYIGPQLTYPVYREGTIGAAKEHLEATAQKMNTTLKAKGGRAFISVNKALVTQASSAIPVVPLYISVLYKVMKQKKLHEGCIEQMYRLSSDGLNLSNVQFDSGNRARVDDWEMRDEVQKEVSALWSQATTENLNALGDLAGYREDFYKLFGFGLPKVDYAADVEVVVDVPSIQPVSDLT